MASSNPFDLLVDVDYDDVSELIAKKASATPTPTATQQQQQPKPQAKLPTKPLPPAQAVREAKGEAGGRGGGRRGGGSGFGGRGGSRGAGGYNREGGSGYNRDGGSGYNREGGGGYNREGGGGYNREGGGRGYNRDRTNNENSFSNNGTPAPTEDGFVVEKPSEREGGYDGTRAPRGGGYGGRRSSNNGEVDGERPRRAFERRSGSGRGNEVKRDGSGRGNWGSPTDEFAQETEELVNPNEKSLTLEKQPGEEESADASKEAPVNEPEEKEPEEKEMTLDEYEKVLEEKRKALLALKVEERKVTVDKELESMQQLSGKKSNHDIFIKLGSDKDKKKEIADKDEKAKKSVSINEFLKPAEGERYGNPGGRGRGRGRGARGGSSGSSGVFGGGNTNAPIPSIEDPGHFPSLK